MPPCLSLRDWYESGKSGPRDHKFTTIYPGTPVSPFHAEPLQLLLRVMKTISVSVVESNGQAHALLSPLTEVQIRLLELWGLPPDLYEKVVRGFPIPPVKMSEP